MLFLRSYPIPTVVFDALESPSYDFRMGEVHIPPTEDDGSSKGIVDIMSEEKVVDGEGVKDRREISKARGVI